MGELSLLEVGEQLLGGRVDVADPPFQVHLGDGIRVEPGEGGQPLRLLGGPLPLGDLLLQLHVGRSQFLGALLDQFFEMGPVLLQFLLRPQPLGDVAGGGEDALHLARLVPVDHGVVEHVDRPAVGVADRQRVVVDQPFGEHLPIALPARSGSVK